MQGHDRISYKKVIHVDYGDAGYIALNIISSGTYEAKKGYISFELSKAMRNFFFNLKKNFTQFQLETALSLRSKFSKRLYELLSQYRGTGIFHIAIRELKLRLGLIDENKGIEKFNNFNMFANLPSLL